MCTMASQRVGCCVKADQTHIHSVRTGGSKSLLFRVLGDALLGGFQMVEGRGVDTLSVTVQGSFTDLLGQRSPQDKAVSPVHNEALRPGTSRSSSHSNIHTGKIRQRKTTKQSHPATTERNQQTSPYFASSFLNCVFYHFRHGFLGSDGPPALWRMRRGPFLSVHTGFYWRSPGMRWDLWHDTTGGSKQWGFHHRILELTSTSSSARC